MNKKMIFYVTLAGLVLNGLINLLFLIFNYESTYVALRIVVIICTGIVGIVLMNEMKNSLNSNKYSLMIGIFAFLFACGAGGVMYILWFKNIGRLTQKEKQKIRYNKNGIKAIKEEKENDNFSGSEGHQKVATYCPYCASLVKTANHCDVCGKDF